ncbi:hypothetical protein RSOLAG22IIIB_06156 [Rhizoctonia solani]|uniref:tyrosinase n=1 Tax=Rhizoctonia solani TaxID=456999 RepID=A0A0K6GC82_9AGAM|nr:hypothetical protein RSOLAG22IIIB_06156 [Rhizoctonia solani]
MGFTPSVFVLKDTYPRLEIRQLAKNAKQFALFILGWEEIRKPDYEPVPAQYVQIGGIHGLPHTLWPGDPDGKEAHHPPPIHYQLPWLGYCCHESPLFPMWHRPVVMLLEQSISEAAHKIAERFANKCPEQADEWKKAANELRFPYWDWTNPDTGEHGLPEMLYQEKLDLTLPPGEPQPAYNMLACYKFGSEYPAGFETVSQENELLPKWVTSYFDQWTQTYRWPKMIPDNHENQIDQINKHLTGGFNEPGSWFQLRLEVATTFNFPTNQIPEEYSANAWDQYSNVRFQSGLTSKNGKTVRIPDAPYWDGANSLENSHNNVHLVLGGTGGHMMDNNYASFDPIFFLHHCNIDRLLAFWEHVYPDIYIGENGYYQPNSTKRKSFTEVDGTWSMKLDQPIDGSSALTPFRKGDGNYWDSNSARWNGDKSEYKYYTYPSIVDPDAPHDPARAVDINKPVLNPEELERQRTVLQKHFGLDHVAERQKEYERIGYYPSFPEPKQQPHEGYEAVHKYRHFVVNVYLDPFILGCSYIVNIRYDLGDAGKGVIGTASVLARSRQEKCAGCQHRREAGARSRHVVVIHHSVVVKILQHRADEASEEAILKTLRADISLPGDIPIARLDTSRTDHSQDLPKELIPVITLSSAGVEAKKVDDPGHIGDQPQDKSPLTPYETYDWQDHGDLPGGWVKA